MTLDHLAEASGVSRGTIHRIELDQVSPRLDTLTELCAALGTGLGPFFNAADGPDPAPPAPSGLRKGTLAWLEHAEALIRNSADSLSVLDRDGRIVFESESGVLFHAGAPEERRARPWWGAAHPEDQAELRRGFEAFVQGGQQVAAHIYRAAHRDGSWHWLRTVLSRKLEHPLIQGIIASTQDVTQLKRADEAAQRARRSESLGIALGGVTHAFSNLLMAVQSHLEFAGRKVGDPGIGAHLEAMTRSLAGADRLLVQMRDFAGNPMVDPGPVDLNELVRGLEPIPPAHLRLDLDASLPPSLADPRLLRRILMELLANACESLDGPGEVTVRTARAVFPGGEPGPGAWLEPSLTLQGDCLLLEVRDSGRGIRAEDLPRICDPFFSTRFTGRGIGLASVLGSVRTLQGALRVSSEEGRGASFQVFLPAAAESEARLPRRGACGRPQGILVVEDEPFLRDCLRQMLASLGQEAVFEAGNGEEAIRAFQAHPWEIGLVLLDLDMPVMGGLEAFKRLRQLDPALVVVFSTGAWEGDPALVGHCSDGITGMLAKPFSMGDLEACLAAYR